MKKSPKLTLGIARWIAFGASVGRPGWIEVLLWVVIGGITIGIHAEDVGAAKLGTGSVLERHWAFQPLQPAQPPVSSEGGSHPIDRFIARGWMQQGLEPVGPADRRTLIRRVFVDVTGLAPTPSEMAAALEETAPDAWERLVDRLLASPRYGERWSRHWMDVVRYSDTAGDNADYPVPELRLYRDYLIDSLNADLPYDQWIREQLAGDLLAKEDPTHRYAERVVATGFLALSRRYATAPFELMHLTLEDTIETTGRTFLGMTFRCARCHDHKYDPVSKEDYYALYGFFAGTRFPYAGSEEFESKKFARSGFVPLLPPSELRSYLDAHDKTLAQAKVDLKRVEDESDAARERNKTQTRFEEAQAKLDRAEKNPATSVDAKAIVELRETVKRLRADRDRAATAFERAMRPLRNRVRRLEKHGAPEGVPVAYAVADERPVDQYVHVRGEPDQKGPVIPRRPPAVLCGGLEWKAPKDASGRRELADWVASADNPLTARVMVNRIWQHHFGAGLVRTPSNFGVRGEAPTHPELLDYLASEFIRRGWSIKAMHRLILTSRTWKLASAHDPKNAAIDPGNSWLWRRSRHRMDAETLRDQWLWLAGDLDLNRPGEHPFPEFDDWHWTQHNPFKAVYESSHRSVYVMRQRIQRHPVLALFDAPDANMSTDVRPESTVPLQALYLLNSDFLGERARALAKRLEREGGDDRRRIQAGYSIAFGREPTDAELRQSLRFLAEASERLTRAGAVSEDARRTAWASLCHVWLISNEAFYVD